MSRLIDFTQGNIAYAIVRFSIPLIMGELLQNLYNSVDALVVGNLVDQHALAAVTVCGVIVNKSNLTALTLEPGDIVRGSGHSAVIWNVTNTEVKVIECWGLNGCKIHYEFSNCPLIHLCQRHPIPGVLFLI